MYNNTWTDIKNTTPIFNTTRIENNEPLKVSPTLSFSVINNKNLCRGLWREVIIKSDISCQILQYMSVLEEI